MAYAISPGALYRAGRSQRRDEFNDIFLSRPFFAHTVICCCYLISGRSAALHTETHRGLMSSSTFHLFARQTARPPGPVLSCPVHSCPLLFCPVLSYPALLCPVLSGPDEYPV